MRTLKVTNMFEMSQVLGISLNTQNESTTIDDIDDDPGITELSLANAITPELLQRDFNIATLTQEKLEKMLRDGK